MQKRQEQKPRTILMPSSLVSHDPFFWMKRGTQPSSFHPEAMHSCTNPPSQLFGAGAQNHTGPSLGSKVSLPHRLCTSSL